MQKLLFVPVAIPRHQPTRLLLKPMVSIHKNLVGSRFGRLFSTPTNDTDSSNRPRLDIVFSNDVKKDLIDEKSTSKSKKVISVPTENKFKTEKINKIRTTLAWISFLLASFLSVAFLCTFFLPLGIIIGLFVFAVLICP